VIRVLIGEDQRMVRGALGTLLGLEPDIEVVSQVGRGDEIVAAAVDSRADVALLDIEMPGLDGLSAAEVLHRTMPDCVIIILTTFGRPGYLRRAMEAGASGFLVKDGPAEDLAAACELDYETLPVGELTARIGELSEKTFRLPGGSERTFTSRTLWSRWLRLR